MVTRQVGWGKMQCLGRIVCVDDRLSYIFVYGIYGHCA